ncbi:immunoglobulin-like domain-containing protein [Methylobacterium nigriterrae]|uniref:immunoglobulin-like domain-containing protein n=1 Tax=Methylobacterium nigriterrae TaxID=3127512 RepID=UPI003013B15E
MVTTATINGQNGSNWQVTLPDGVTLSQSGVTTGPYFLDAAHPVLTFNYKYDLSAVFGPTLAHGIASIEFKDLVGGGENNDQGNGLRGQIAINIVNDLGVPLGTSTGEPFLIYLGDLQSDSENTPNISHPLYAHFHGVGTSYGSLKASSGTFSGAGTPGAPDKIDLTGIVAAGTTASIGPFTLHERDQANSDDSFSLNFFPTIDTISPGDFAKLQAQWDALHPPVYSIANAADVFEGSKLIFTVKGTNAVSQDVTITTDHGNVTVKAGQTTGTLEVQTQDNTTFGPNPDVTVTLTGTVVGAIDPAAKTAIGHVKDNDIATPPEHLNPVYRFFDSATQDHFYTTSAAEKDVILKTLPTYHYEGAQWDTPDKGAGTIDVFRFFDSTHNSHFFTTSVAERDFVIQTQPNYHFEGVAFEAYANASAAGSGALTLERFFNTNTGLHHYSASASETNGIKQGAAGPGWIDEGPGFIVHVPTDGMLNA